MALTTETEQDKDIEIDTRSQEAGDQLQGAQEQDGTDIAELNVTDTHLARLAQLATETRSVRKQFHESQEELKPAKATDPKTSHREMLENRRALAEVNLQIYKAAKQKAEAFLAKQLEPLAIISAAPEILTEVNQAKKTLSENEDQNYHMATYQDRLRKTAELRTIEKYGAQNASGLKAKIDTIDQEIDGLNDSITQEYRQHPLARLKRVFKIKADFEQEGVKRINELRAQKKQIQDDKDAIPREILGVEAADSTNLDFLQREILKKVQEASVAYADNSPLFQELDKFVDEIPNFNQSEREDSNSSLPEADHRKALSSYLDTRLRQIEIFTADETARRNLAEKITNLAMIRQQDLDPNEFIARSQAATAEVWSAQAEVDSAIPQPSIEHILRELIGDNATQRIEYLLEHAEQFDKMQQISASTEKMIESLDALSQDSSQMLDQGFIDRMQARVNAFKDKMSEFENVNPILCRAYIRNETITQKFGLERVKAVEQVLARNLASKLLDSTEPKSKETQAIERKIIDLGSTANIELILLAGFAQPGESGEWPLVAWHERQIGLSNFVNNLDPTELQKFSENPDNKAASDLIRYIQANPRDFREKMYEDPGAAQLVNNLYATGLDHADVSQERFMYRRLPHAVKEVDRAPFIERSLDANIHSLKGKFLESALIIENYRYAERIMQNKFASPEFLGSLARNLVDKPDINLPFLAETLEKTLNYEDLVRHNLETILTLFAHTNASKECFDKLANPIYDRQPYINESRATSLTRIALSGNEKALDWLSNAYNSEVNLSIRSVIMSEVTRSVKEGSSEIGIKQFFARQFQLVKNGSDQQQAFASSIIQDATKNTSEFQAGQTGLLPYLSGNLTDYTIDLSNSENPILQLHNINNRVSSEEFNESDFRLYLKIFEENPELTLEATNFSFEPPNNFFDKNFLKLSPEQSNKLIGVLFAGAKNENGQSAAARRASILHLRGILSAENQSLLKAQPPDKTITTPTDLNLVVRGQEEITDNNWLGMLASYITTDGAEQTNLEPELIELLRSEMSNPEKMDLCLEKFRAAYRDHLDEMRNDSRNIDAAYLTSVVKQNDGAGHLRHIGALAEVTDALKALDEERTTAYTKQDVLRSLSELEGFFDKNRWGNEDRSFFYNVAAETIKAAPSLFPELCDGLKNLDPKHGREFVKNMFPLLQAQIVLAEKPTKYGRTTKDLRKLVDIRRHLIGYREAIGSGKPYQETTAELKAVFVENIKASFKEKFGIKKIPEEMLPEDIRALQDFIIYFGNLNDKDAQKSAVLSLFLALTINRQWEDLRQNKLVLGQTEGSFRLDEYFEEGSQTYNYAATYLRARAATAFLPSQTLGVEAEDMADFNALLQEEETVQYLGNIQTVDNKLEGILRQLEAFSDPDTFPEQSRALLPIIQENAPRTINSALGKRIQVEMGKNIPLTEEDSKLIEQLLAAQPSDKPIKDRLIDIQSEIKIMTQTQSILQKSEEYTAEIAKLRESLKPNERIIEIFKGIGEDFTTESGAIAVSQDLSYLEAILNKNQDKLSDPKDLEDVDAYINQIREQMKVLEKAVSDIDGKLAAVLAQAQDQQQEGIANITSEMIQNIRRRETEMKILSVCTNRWVQIIENMRQCLACNTRGCNNDTNLSFGDPNKFYLFSQSGEKGVEEGSIADEIVFLSPINVRGKQEMSFVFDRVYGNNSPDILIGHIISIAKKYSKIKGKFKDANLSIFITDAAMRSAGVDSATLTSRLPEDLGLQVDLPMAEVNVIASPASDHYIEFGGGSRAAGQRPVEGMRLTAIETTAREPEKTNAA